MVWRLWPFIYVPEAGQGYCCPEQVTLYLLMCINSFLINRPFKRPNMIFEISFSSRPVSRKTGAYHVNLAALALAYKFFCAILVSYLTSLVRSKVVCQRVYRVWFIFSYTIGEVSSCSNLCTHGGTESFVEGSRKLWCYKKEKIEICLFIMSKRRVRLSY